MSFFSKRQMANLFHFGYLSKLLKISATGIGTYVVLKSMWKYLSRNEANKHKYMNIRAHYVIHRYKLFRYFIPMLCTNILHLLLSKSKIFKDLKMSQHKNDETMEPFLTLFCMAFYGVITSFIFDRLLNKKIFNPYTLFQTEIEKDFKWYNKSVLNVLKDKFKDDTNTNNEYSSYLSNIILDYVSSKEDHQYKARQFIQQMFDDYKKDAARSSNRNAAQNGNTSEAESKSVPDFFYFWGNSWFGINVNLWKLKHGLLKDHIINALLWYTVNFGIFQLLMDEPLNAWYIATVFQREIFGFCVTILIIAAMIWIGLPIGLGMEIYQYFNK